MSGQRRRSVNDIIRASKEIAGREDHFRELSEKRVLPPAFADALRRMDDESESALKATWRHMAPHLETAGLVMRDWTAYVKSAHMFDSLLQHCTNNLRLKREDTRRAFEIAANNLIPLNERHRAEWRALKASLPRYPPPKKPQWAFSWERERKAMRFVLPRLLVRGAILALLLWGAFAGLATFNAPETSGWFKFGYYVLLVACLEQAKMFGMAAWLPDNRPSNETTAVTHTVLMPLGCFAVLIPFSPLWLAAQALGLLLLLNYGYRAVLFVIGRREAAKRDYTDEIGELLIGI